MLARLRRLLSYEFTIAELIGVAVMVLTPYFVIGVVWALAHPGHFHDLYGLGRAVSVLSSVALWPLLLFPHILIFGEPPAVLAPNVCLV